MPVQSNGAVPSAENVGKTRITGMMSPPHMEDPETIPSDAPDADAPAVPGLRQDLAVLMKVRLNFFVLITAFFGFLLASRGAPFEWMKLVHTILGAAAAAFGSAAFNQLMEIELDARMKRTADRPLPSRRMDPIVAFGIGWVLCAIGIIHLAVQVGHLAAYLTAATIAIYVFVYTPLKRVSSTNTLVGAIPGAIPPVIGWVGAGGALGWEAWFLFGPAVLLAAAPFHRHQLAVPR
jgi:heme o synthase